VATLLLLLFSSNICFAFTLFETPSHGNRIRSIAASLLHQTSEIAESDLASVEDDTSSISVHLPENWRDSSSNDACWCATAANILHKFGVVALRSSSGVSLMEHDLCDNANDAATTRLQEMHRRIESRGLDPTGVDEPYRFSEIVCRDEGGKRYDVPIEWLGESSEEMEMTAVGSGRIGTPLEQVERDAIAKLDDSIDRIAKPVLDSLWSQRKSYVAAAGFLINRPGSQSQNWHRDGPEEGFIDCFVPLIDLNESVGPTAIQPGTHKSGCEEGDVVVPMLKKGELLLFDYRTIHRGQGNQSDSTTRTLAYAVYRRREKESSNGTSGDIHNFPAALTLEFD
jgi:hypothetical protein